MPSINSLCEDLIADVTMSPSWLLQSICGGHDQNLSVSSGVLSSEILTHLSLRPNNAHFAIHFAIHFVHTTKHKDRPNWSKVWLWLSTLCQCQSLLHLYSFCLVTRAQLAFAQLWPLCSSAHFLVLTLSKLTTFIDLDIVLQWHHLLNISNSQWTSPMQSEYIWLSIAQLIMIWHVSTLQRICCYIYVVACG